MLPKLPESPRAWHRLIVVRALVSSLMLSGCVEATAYEQATSAAAVQGEARRRLAHDVRQKSAELAALRLERDRLRAANQRLEAELGRSEGAVDQAELELVLAKQEQNEGASLVQQLRGDLARVGSHMDTFAEEKAGLGSELEAARAENERLAARVSELEAEKAATSQGSVTAPTDAPAGAEAEAAPPTDDDALPPMAED